MTDEIYSRPPIDKRDRVKAIIDSSWIAAPDAGRSEAEQLAAEQAAARYCKRHDERFGHEFMTDREGRIVSARLARRLGFEVMDDNPDDYGDMGDPDPGR